MAEHHPRTQRKVALGIVTGLCLAVCCAQSEEVIIWAKYVLFDDTKAQLGAKDVQQALETLQQRVAALESGDCPVGYTHDKSQASITLCKRGSDEVVRVGDFWIDRYESSLVAAASFNKGTCDGKWTQHGLGTPGVYPAGFPESGNWKATPVMACSVPGIEPSRSMTWFQAAQACALAGKHLCTNAEWQAAAAGTPKDSCNINNQVTMTPVKSGATTACRSKWGAMDMVGNVSEWVAIWGVAGKHFMTVDHLPKEWPKGYGDRDVAINFNGSVDTGKGYVEGLPASARRGGDFNDAKAAGVFTVDMHIAPVYASITTGMRCCRR